jgi:FKBP-type peptidyl-prolyl cis-trans isomerase FkpA
MNPPNKTFVALLAVLSFVALCVAGCGGSQPADQSAPTSTPAPQSAAEPVKPAEMPAAPPNTVGPAATPPPAPPATAKPAPVKPVAPERPAYTRTDLEAGTGAEARKGARLQVHYTGWLYDPAQPDLKGRMFDTSKERGPFDFVLGAGQVIPGWDQGFNGMKVGGRRRLIIPSDLAYGVDGAGNGIIPPNATLLFEMELLEVQ